MRLTAFSKLLMRQHLRANPTGFSANSTESNKWYALLTINEIKSFDSKTGGPTQLAILDKTDFVILNTKDLLEYYLKKRESIARDTAERQKNLGVTYDHVFHIFQIHNINRVLTTFENGLNQPES